MKALPLELQMTLDEKVRKTLGQLGVKSGDDIHGLFIEARSLMDNERLTLIRDGASSDKDKERKCRELHDRWLTRKNGIISLIDQNWLKPVHKDWKPVVGRLFNGLRQAATELEFDGLVKQVKVRLDVSAEDRFIITEEATATAKWGVSADLTLPGYHRPLGSIHPITRVQREIEDIFLNLGFSIETGPEVETVYYNFDALNIPETHPARDDMDTLYVNSKTVLRTHTSPVQIRAMQKYGAPLYIIAPGKVYRHDNPDSSHSPMFHQIEGLAIDTDITFADLKGTLDFFAKKFFGEKIRTRFSPTYFPFTEPSGEVAITCVICDGRGCRTCKETGWMEVLGCGMVHPEVLRHGDIDPDRYSGWAFGFGIDRMAMIKYDINDIQLFFQGDARFLRQF